MQYLTQVKVLTPSAGLWHVRTLARFSSAARNSSGVLAFCYIIYRFATLAYAHLCILN
jgi:hypothetical protein